MGEHEISLRLLGPVEVRHGPEWSRIPAAKQRTMLAILAMNLGIPVSADRLVEDLWQERLPRNPANQLQVLAYRLRRTLDDDQANVLQTRGFGYALMLANDQIDIGLFEALAARATLALREDRPAVAEELCVEGLRLWRAQPFADTRIPASLTADVARLTEERLALSETLVDARLLLGRNAELVPELTMATADHPFREHRWAQLMLACYRSGRRAEAFEAYRKAYHLLADELGAEPGEELQTLHRRMLATDPTLLDIGQPHVLPGRTVTHREIVPRQLPTALRHFVGRASELKLLNEISDQSIASDKPTIVVVSGPGGIGKTALAIYWAHWASSQFPDGHLYLNLRGFDPSGRPMTANEAIGDLLFALGVHVDEQPPTQSAKAALYRSLMVNRRMLLILDNASDASQARPLLPGMARCMVIVTSRNPLVSLVAAEGARAIALEVLSPADAHEMFDSYLGPTRVEAELNAAATVARQCAYMPLALAIAASRAAVAPRMTLSSLAADLSGTDQRLDALSCGEELTDVKAVLSWSYRGASAAAQRMFRLLSVHPGPNLTVEAAARLADISVTSARRLLSELALTSLISERGDGRYEFHDLLRVYSLGLSGIVDTAARRDAASRRMLDYYLRAAYQAAIALEPEREGEIELVSMANTPDAGPSARGEIGPRPAFAWFTAEYRVLLRIADMAARSGYHPYTWQIGWALTDYFRRSGQWHDWIVVQRAALDAAYSLGDFVAMGHAHRSLARAYCWHGKFDDCQRHLRRALALFEDAGNKLGQAHVHRNLAYVHEQMGDDGLALQHAELALRYYRVAGHTAGGARALNTVGWYQAKAGDFRRAIANCTEALRILREIGHSSGEAATWDSLGFAHRGLGEFARAVRCFENALDILREIRDRDGEADTLTHLAETLEAAGDGAKAQETLARAHAILTALNPPGGVDPESQPPTFSQPDATGPG